MWKAILAAGLLVPLPALADGCVGLGDAVFCTDEPAVAVGAPVPSDGEREESAPSLIPAGIQVPRKGDATPWLRGETACVALGDMSCG